MNQLHGYSINDINCEHTLQSEHLEHGHLFEACVVRVVYTVIMTMITLKCSHMCNVAHCTHSFI